MGPSGGFKGLQARITNHFEEKGFNGAQIAKAIFIHECLGVALLGDKHSTLDFLYCRA